MLKLPPLRGQAWAQDQGQVEKEDPEPDPDVSLELAAPVQWQHHQVTQQQSSNSLQQEEGRGTPDIFVKDKENEVSRGFNSH